MRDYKYLMLVFLIATMTGCGTLTKEKNFSPNQVQLNIDLNNLDYLGETEIEVTYRTYFGIIKVMDTVNGEMYDATNSLVTTLGNGTILSGNIKKAAYKAIQKYPDATYFQPVRKIRQVNRLFLGKEVSEKAIIRAYKFK